VGQFQTFFHGPNQWNKQMICLPIFLVGPIKPYSPGLGSCAGVIVTNRVEPRFAQGAVILNCFSNVFYYLKTKVESTTVETRTGSPRDLGPDPPDCGSLEILESGIQKMQNMEILKSNIRSAQNVRNVLISRETNLLTLFGTISDNVFHGSNKYKHCVFRLPIFLGGPIGSYLPGLGCRCYYACLP